MLRKALVTLALFGAFVLSHAQELQHRWKLDVQGGKTTVSKIVTYDLIKPIELPLVGETSFWAFAGINVANQAPLGGFCAVKEFNASKDIRGFAGVQWQMQNDVATGFAPIVGFTLRF